MRGKRDSKTKGCKRRVRKITVLKETNDGKRRGPGIKEARGYPGGLWLRCLGILSVRRERGPHM